MTSAPSPPQSESAAAVIDDVNAEAIRSYAEALVNAAASLGDPEAAVGELEEIAALAFRGQPEYLEIFQSPTIPGHVKERVLAETFDGKVSPLSFNFLRVLNRHGRIELLSAILRAAKTLLDRKANRMAMVVRSAGPLEDSEKEAIEKRLEQTTGMKPVVSWEVDPDLLAGFVAQIGDDVYDASAKHQLDQIRNSLIEGKNHEISSRRNQFSDPA